MFADVHNLNYILLLTDHPIITDVSIVQSDGTLLMIFFIFYF